MDILGKPKYLAMAIVSAALFFALLALTSNMIVWGYWELNPFVEPARIAMNVFIAMLFGANIGVLLHNSDLRNTVAGGTQMTVFGALAALMTSSCPLCQPFFMLAFGLGGIGALFAGFSILIALFSIGLLAISLKRGLEAANGTCKLDTRRR
ncbi:MAG: hypothetical protein V1861_06735 [Candidatus Micrarchaeota archaeon]